MYQFNTAIRSESGRVRMHAPYSEDTRKLSLDGLWKAYAYDCIEDVPEDWDKMTPGADARDYQVPGCFELQGMGLPVYTNITYPFERDEDHRFEKEVKQGEFELLAPYLPKKNQTVCCYREFELTEALLGKDGIGDQKIYLNFEGVETCMFLSVNGKKVGSSEDSKLDCEFDVTEYVQPGRNTLAVQVRSFSAGSYLEDQDYWHFHGITRPVEIFVKNSFYIKDFQAKTSFGYNLDDAQLSLRVWVNEDAPRFGEGRVELELLDPKGEPVLQQSSRPVGEYGFYLFALHVIDEKFKVHAPVLWSAENPVLYTLNLKLKDYEGKVCDTASCRIGFREVRIQDGVLELNRKRLIIRGANLHDSSAKNGRSVTTEELRQQLYAMKRLNFNAVRTCHYPKKHVFYDLCDEIGLYVVDEANIETHGYGGGLSDDPLWLDAYMQRGVRMVLRDKNHPSIIVWSLGNESGVGANHAALYGWMKYYDGRPVQYESGGSPKEVSDIICAMYPDMDWISTCMAEDHRPFICCEYIYAKSNSNGNADEYWDAVRHYKRFQGGFLWDFIDKAIEVEADGQKVFRYGGAFGEKITDRCLDMCLNGIVFADVTDKPAAAEIKNLQAPLYVKYMSWHGMQGAYHLFNEQLESDCSDLEFKWELVCNGEIAESGIYEGLAIAPGRDVILNLPYHKEKVSGEAFFNFYALRKEACAYAPAGDVVFKCQIELDESEVYAEEENLSAGSCDRIEVYELSEDLSRIERFLSDTEEGRIDYENSKDKIKVWLGEGRPGICMLSKDGSNLLTDLKDGFYRAPTGIDEGQDEFCYNTDWLAAGIHDLQVDSFVRDVKTTGAEVLIEEQISYNKGIMKVNRTFRICNEGMEIHARVINNVKADTIPRIGMRMQLADRYSRVRWYGRGGQENYADRKSSAFVGIYESAVADLHEHYVKPCDCGGREDVRYLDLLGEDGRSLHITGGNNFHFSALPWSVEAYTGADYEEELGKACGTHLCIDAFHAGLGGDTGWTRNIHPQYRIPRGKYEYSFRICW